MTARKKAIITGAGRRFGLALCKFFIEQQYSVYAITRSSSAELNDLYSNNSGQLQVIECGGYDAQCLKHLFEALPEQHYDVLVNNASLFEDDVALGPESVEQFTQCFNVHMALPAMLSQWFAEQFKASAETDAGLIINMSDIYVDNPMPNRAYYSATKAGLENLSLSFAKAFGPDIRVNSIQPGAVAFLPEHSDDAKQKVLEGSLLATVGGFEALLKAVQYLLDNGFVTATTLKVDGGRSVAR